ncbi:MULTISPECIES: metal ABC transporter solute-binding protein, Zn/Mn family [Microbulbifer]|uniref:metal ABC transporter solute-binding protein, Zn/Mn family n=1 Tax=Microbulbifer TaxID=48073 RepID=UPI001F37D73E
MIISQFTPDPMARESRILMNFPQYPVKYLLLFPLFLMLAACAREASEPEPDNKALVVSVRPLALIVREVAEPDTPVQVLAANGDPHHYAPGVSDRAALESARLVIWLGPQMESALARQLSLLPQGRQLQLLEQDGYEFGGASAEDFHLWLRPRNAAVMAAHIAARLAELDPRRADAYRQRARDFSRRMANLQKVLDRALWAYRDVPIVVTHDAYGHFFGPAGVETQALADSAHGGHGARAMLELRDGLGESAAGSGCLFGEVPENARDRQTAENLGLRYATLDPLGTQLPAGADYESLVQAWLAQARSCLAEVPDRSDRG